MCRIRRPRVTPRGRALRFTRLSAEPSLRAALTLVAIGALSCCAISYAPREPTSATESLLVGQLRLVAGGFPTAMTANGTYVANIQIEIRDLATGRELSARSAGPDGMIMITALPPGGPYAIVGFKAVLPAGWGTSQVVAYSPERPYAFVVRPGVVNNFGLIVWRIDHASGRQSQAAGSGYATVRESFRTLYGRSAWLHFRWESREPQRRLIRADRGSAAPRDPSRSARRGEGMRWVPFRASAEPNPKTGAESQGSC